MFETIELHSNALKFSAITAGSGPLVFCLHGFPDTAHTFSKQIKEIAEAGYKVIAPMMRGYETTSQPNNNNYSIGAIANDVINWADELGEQKFNIIGHDWGSVVSYIVAGMFPERLYSITTIAVPHATFFKYGIVKVPSQLLKSWYMLFFQFRLVSEPVVRRNDWALLKKLWRDWSPDYHLSISEWEVLKSTFDTKGVLQAMLAYYRQNATPLKLMGLTSSKMTEFKTINVPTYAITGKNDGCIDSKIFDHCFPAEHFPKGVQIEKIADAGHFLHREVPEKLNSFIINWLDKNTETAKGFPIS